MKRSCFFMIACIALMSCKEQAGVPVARNKQWPGALLPSWNDGAAKKAIITFVTNTTTRGHKDFVPVADRIACLDNDGTLWGEQAMYVQLAFALDQVRELAPRHPEWYREQPFKSVLNGNATGVPEGGDEALLKILAATHAGMTTEEFGIRVSRWIKIARHPQSGMLYSQMVFKPMLELIAYLKANEYQVFIVSGGGVDFMRAWACPVYGIPAHQIIGSSGNLKYEARCGIQPQILKLPGIRFIDDKEAKPLGIWQSIGKRPVFAIGNSDGDYAMLQWVTTATTYPHFGGIIHHTDAEREYQYDRETHFGRLDKGLDDAAKNGWILIDMKKDWNTIYPAHP